MTFAASEQETVRMNRVSDAVEIHKKLPLMSHWSQLDPNLLGDSGASNGSGGAEGVSRGDRKPFRVQ